MILEGPYSGFKETSSCLVRDVWGIGFTDQRSFPKKPNRRRTFDRHATPILRVLCKCEYGQAWIVKA